MERQSEDLTRYLQRFADGEPKRAGTAAADVIGGIAQAATRVEEILREPGCEQVPDKVSDRAKQEFRRALDGKGHIVFDELAGSPPPASSNEVAVIIQPLANSSKIVFNGPVGSLFTILPIDPGVEPTIDVRGTSQIAAGFISYGSRTTMALTLGAGTQMFVLSRTGEFVMSGPPCRIGPKSGLHGIDMSFREYWNNEIRNYVEERLSRQDGPLAEDFITHWTNSLIMETLQVLLRGGICIYPSDAKSSHEPGSVMTVEEANPVAFLVEQAGGAAVDGFDRILELDPSRVRRRTPFIFGAREGTLRIVKYCRTSSNLGTKSPLFSTRGLFRA